MRRDAAMSVAALCRAPAGAWSNPTPGPRGSRLAVVAFAVLIGLPVLAAPRGIADCEAIKEADAYNRCLASFGPVRGQRGASYPGAASEGGKGGGGKKAAVRRGSGLPSGAQVTRGGGGRVRMEFTPGRR